MLQYIILYTVYYVVKDLQQVIILQYRQYLQ